MVSLVALRWNKTLEEVESWRASKIKKHYKLLMYEISKQKESIEE